MKQTARRAQTLTIVLILVPTLLLLLALITALDRQQTLEESSDVVNLEIQSAKDAALRPLKATEEYLEAAAQLKVHDTTETLNELSYALRYVKSVRQSRRK